MRIVTALGLCDETGVETYKANVRTNIMVEPFGQDGVQCMSVWPGRDLL